MESDMSCKRNVSSLHVNLAAQRTVEPNHVIRCYQHVKFEQRCFALSAWFGIKIEFVLLQDLSRFLTPSIFQLMSAFSKRDAST